MRRIAKPLIALVAAYGLVLASLLASVAGGHAAATSTVLCLSSASTDGQAPAPEAPRNHDLTCLSGCGAVAAGFVPEITVVAVQLASSSSRVRATSAVHPQSSIFGALSARGPPARS